MRDAVQLNKEKMRLELRDDEVKFRSRVTGRHLREREEMREWQRKEKRVDGRTLPDARIQQPPALSLAAKEQMHWEYARPDLAPFSTQVHWYIGTFVHWYIGTVHKHATLVQPSA